MRQYLLKVNRIFILTGFILVLASLKPGLSVAQSFQDTLYPGYDLVMISMEPAKNEVIQGEGVVLNISIKNAGASVSPAAKIHFWVSASDENLLNPEEIIDTKEVIELESLAKLDFAKLIVIPPDYVGDHVYITAVMIPAGTVKDPTPDNNQRFTALKIGFPGSYKGGMYAFDAAIQSFDLSEKSRKYNRDKPVSISTSYIISGVKAAKSGHTLEIYLSKDNKADNGDSVIGIFLLPTAANKEVKTLVKQVVIGKQFARGKAFLYARIISTKWFDPNESNNTSQLRKIRIKK